MKNISVDKILTWLTLGIIRFVYVREGTNVIITRFGKYVRTLKPGLNWFLSLSGLLGQIHYYYVTDPNTLEVKHTHEIDMKEIVFDFPKEKVISKDNVEFKVDAIVFFRVVEPRKAVFNVNDYVKSLQLTIRSILRDEIGRYNLEQVYCSRGKISRNLEVEADKAVTNWGLDVTQLEIKEFELGDFARELIEQKQEELEKRKQILRAEGLKEAKIQEGEALKAYAEMEAEAIRIKARARAEAEKYKFDAEVYGYKKIAKIIKEEPTILTNYFQLHNAEKISQNLGQGQATTVFLPSDMRLMVRALNVFNESKDLNDNISNKEMENNNQTQV
ncbi:SPFH domain-containing protein [Halothermothrix orenii]|uniref:Band 7 protein n=1 Tax=Halothermothrix orenii (strain H 168 / OCM 544 / DSM 9562) TaxID=373903 RepID=B8D0R4_HALOH|nr:stomatin-like protein [Halothermothrix orenii]ACL71000.1 band 7 protein [Halothermothrix orenii H 168]